MFDLINRATREARLCFYFVRHCGDCMIVTDSGGNKRYVIGYMEDVEGFWVRCKELEGEENEGTDVISSVNLGNSDNRSPLQKQEEMDKPEETSFIHEVKQWV